MCWASGANRPPSEGGVEYRLGSSIIKNASPKNDVLGFLGCDVLVFLDATICCNNFAR
jgi:hypothetical protein